MQLQQFNFKSIHKINLKPFLAQGTNQDKLAQSKKLRDICKTSGFFYVENHQVPQNLTNQLINLSKRFFQLDKSEKQKIHMKFGGSSWRGYFSVGEQLTSGKVDVKQGIYFGQQLDESHPLVAAKTPLYGRNLFPQQPKQLKDIVLKWISQMQNLGKIIMRIIAMSLGLQQIFFQNNLTKNPLGLFRIFNYPPDQTDRWGVGQHTDYGLITILLVTDEGLQVKNRTNQWIKANVIPNTFIVNIGDMLQRLTKGLYRSTPHRAQNKNKINRLGIPFFYDPGWNEVVEQLEIKIEKEQQILVRQSQLVQRWDKQTLSNINYPYGQYLIKKISKVFPNLAENNLGEY